jgi:Tol biopolymer transport system component
VFHSNLGGSDFDIWTIPATGGTPTKLAGFVGYGDYDPSYSNNGQYVAYAGYTIPPPLFKSAEEATVSSFAATVPREFKLGQNYPNPFNPTTVIEYVIPKDEFVSLIVYNPLGKEVAILARGISPAGVHSVTFDAEQLPSGVYFYRLVAGTFKETKKLVVVK